ncbi:hypothetical protein HN51_035672, partial [Arachis hypogaea]
ASDPHLHHAVYFTADAVGGGPHLCVNSFLHQVTLETQPTSPNESEDYLPGSDVNRGNGSDVKVIKDEDSQQ